MEKFDLYWLAGILEGEGSFLKGPPTRPARCAITMVTTDEDIIQRVAGLLGGSYWVVGEKRRAKNPHWKKVFATRLSGRRAVDLMTRLRPMMGNRRKEQIDAAIQSFEQNVKAGEYLDEVTALQIIRENGKGGKTQTQIAEKFGLRRETVNKLCRGKLPKWAYLTARLDGG